MKKLLLFAALVLGAVSCMKDNSFEANVGGEADVVLSVALPADVTRAINQDSSKGAIGNIDLAQYDIRYILEVFDANNTLAKRVENYEDTATETTFELRLIPGRHYSFVVWADFVAQGSEDALHYDAESLREIEIIGVQNAMDESRDAYTGIFRTSDNGGQPFSSSSQIGFELKRPFAKLRVVANDIDEIYSSLVGATIEYTAQTHQQYDALTKVSSEPATVSKSVDYTSEAYLYAGEPTTEGEQTLFADYILGTQNGTVQFIMTVADDVQALPAVNFNTAIPVQSNYLTTIYGPILTDSNNVTVTINPAFENKDDFEKEPWYVEVWDGTSVTEPEVETVVDEATGEEVEVVVIDQPSDLAWLAGFVNGTNEFANASIFATRAGNEPVNFELRANIDLANYPWTPIGTPENNFVGTFNGNGFSIGNLNIVVDEAKEGKAYMGLFGYAKNVTIKNLILANANVNVACLDIDHSQGHIGAVAGSLEGTSTIENVTVKGDITVYATQTANGASRVAVIAGGNSYGNVTMKNVHVIANEGSSLIANNNTGALAGQLQGKMVFENCSSNIDVTANKFFAGGLVGIAAGDSYIKNCHTSGDIAVVAGREGRHNDEYRVGGIAGGWADGKTKVCTLEGCSYTGKVSGKNADGSVAEPLDYMGYVGRGYTLANCEGSKVVIDGTEFVQKYDNVYGVYTINGLTPVATADELIAALEANEGVIFMNDIKIEPASMSNAYGATGINVKNGQTIDGNGHTLNIKGAGGTWDSGINTTGGLIKNLTVTGSFRGIFINHTSSHSEKVVLENVTIGGNGTVYTISCDQGLYQGIEATNCTFNGWTSFAKTAGEAKFVNCYFGAGSGYKYCRPYSNTEFVGCTFCPGYAVDTTRATVTFTECTWEE